MITRINTAQRFQTPQTQSEGPKQPTPQAQKQSFGKLELDYYQKLNIKTAATIAVSALAIWGFFKFAHDYDEKRKNNPMAYENNEQLTKRKLETATNYASMDKDSASIEKTMKVLNDQRMKDFHLTPEQILRMQIDYLNQKTCSIGAVKLAGEAVSDVFQPTANYLKELAKHAPK